MTNKILNISLVTKIINEFPEMSIYKRYSDKAKFMYFMIKDAKSFWQIYDNLRIKKDLIVNLI